MIPTPLHNADVLYLAEENHGKTGSASLAVVEPASLPALAEEFLAAGYHLEDVSGLMVREGALSVYHFDHFDQPGRVTVLAIAPLDSPVFPSIASIYQGAEWHERETRDFYGFTYDGNPNFIPLLMPEDMAEVHPLAKAESALAPLAAIFSAEGRDRKVLKIKDGFTSLDAPVKEEAAPAAPEQAAPKAEKPAVASVPKTAPTAPVETAGADASAEPAGKAAALTVAPESVVDDRHAPPADTPTSNSSEKTESVAEGQAADSGPAKTSSTVEEASDSGPAEAASAVDAQKADQAAEKLAQAMEAVTAAIAGMRETDDETALLTGREQKLLGQEEPKALLEREEPKALLTEAIADVLVTADRPATDPAKGRAVETKSESVSQAKPASPKQAPKGPGKKAKPGKQSKGSAPAKKSAKSGGRKGA